VINTTACGEIRTWVLSHRSQSTPTMTTRCRLSWPAWTRWSHDTFNWLSTRCMLPESSCLH